ncbi:MULTISPECIES: hypothetical protein [Bacteria]|uniref:hypothetical protein n=1 Tax=Bacteria TaxID=2 RepID=UPI003B7B3780
MTISPTTYRTRPVTIEAVRFTSWTQAHEIARWCGGQAESNSESTDRAEVVYWVWVPSPDGCLQKALVGDYIVHSEGGFYPLRPYAFDALLEVDPS